jgi:cytochrome P450
MTDYLSRIDAAPSTERWPLVRGWLYSESLPFFAELRANRPVLVLPELTFCTRHADCTLILRRHDVFGVDLYKPKQGDFFMAQDDTARHWREKSIMKAILDFEEVPAIRQWIGEETARRLDAAGGSIEAVRQIGRGVPTAMVQHWFGYSGSNADNLIDWSYWNQQDAFHNQPFDAPGPVCPEEIIKKRKRAGICMAIYLGRLIAKRAIAVKLGSKADDSVSRLLRLSFTGALKFNVKQVVFNTGGLLIGAVETTSHTITNALEFLMADPVRLEQAKAAAAGGDLRVFDGFVFEALRFRPAFPYFFRTCHRSTVLAGGTPHAKTVAPGTTVLAVSHSAMFDEAGFPDAERFHPERDQGDNFTLGLGIHECLGRAIAAVMMPEIVRQILLKPGLKADGPVDYGGTKVPQKWQLGWQG